MKHKIIFCTILHISIFCVSMIALKNNYNWASLDTYMKGLLVGSWFSWLAIGYASLQEKNQEAKAKNE